MFFNINYILNIYFMVINDLICLMIIIISCIMYYLDDRLMIFIFSDFVLRNLLQLSIK